MAKSKALSELENLIRRICRQVIREYPGFVQIGEILMKEQDDIKIIKAFIKNQELINKGVEQMLSDLSDMKDSNEDEEDVQTNKDVEHVSSDRLKAFRISREISQKVVADLLGVSVKIYSKWERGESIMSSAFEERFCNIEHISATDLRKKMQEHGHYEISGKRIRTPDKATEQNQKKTVLISIITPEQLSDLRIMLGKTVEDMNESFDPKERRYEKWQSGKSRPPSTTAKTLLDLYDKKIKDFEQRTQNATQSKAARRYYESSKLPRAAIREGRKRLGLTCRQIAEELGVPRTTYRNWECGNSRPPSEMIEKMQVMFGNSPTESVYDAARRHVVAISSKGDKMSKTIPWKELRLLRLRANLTGKQMAQLLNVPYSRYHNWENKGRYVASEYISIVRMLQKMSDKDLKEKIVWLGKNTAPMTNREETRRKTK